MSTVALGGVPRARRRTRFVDRSVQGSLLVGLVLLELLLFAAGLVMVYLALHHVIDAQAYRVHHFALDGRPLMLQALLPVVGLIVGINVVAVFIADRFWSAYIDTIVAPLRALLARAATLDLRSLVDPDRAHPVLTAAGEWIDAERERYQAIRAVIDELQGRIDAPEHDPDAAALMPLLNELRERLSR